MFDRIVEKCRFFDVLRSIIERDSHTLLINRCDELLTRLLAGLDRAAPTATNITGSGRLPSCLNLDFTVFFVRIVNFDMLRCVESLRSKVSQVMLSFSIARRLDCLVYNLSTITVDICCTAVTHVLKFFSIGVKVVYYRNITAFFMQGGSTCLVDRLHRTLCIELLHELVCLLHHAMRLAHRSDIRRHCRIRARVSKACPDDPLFFERFIDVHIDREPLERLTITDLIALPLHLALSLQFLKADRAQNHFVQRKNLSKHVHFDRACLLRVDLNEQLFNLLLDFVTLLLILHLFQLAVEQTARYLL